MSIIKTTLEDHIAIVTINRPEAYNAMNPDVIESLENQINEFINNDNVGVIILTGEGDKAFIAGADIKRMNEMSQKEALEKHSVNLLSGGGGGRCCCRCYCSAQKLQISQNLGTFLQGSPKVTTRCKT